MGDVTPLFRDRKKPTQELSEQESFDLYAALRYYGRQTITDAVYNMFHRDETPLPTSLWSNTDDFFVTYTFLKKMARGLNRNAFYQHIRAAFIPESIEFSKPEREVMVNREIYAQQCVYLLEFFNALPDYFNYEVHLLELGYPVEPAS